VTYLPLTMTGDRKHTGSIFFPLPDGTGLLYNLTGTANAPKPVGKRNRDVPCKQACVEVLPVENWLKKPQRFRVSFEVLKPEKPDPSTTIRGNDYIDVPGNGSKDYLLHYYAHKEGATLLRMVFKNEQTGEYGFYEIGFKSSKGGSVGTVDLVTQVRVPVSYSLKLENPLANMVTFNAVCASNTEVLIPASLAIIGKGQGDFNFEFLPLKAGETSSKLELTSPDLGTCVYDLNLKALPAAAERPIHFKTSLGNSQTLTGKILNFCRIKTDYLCKVG
jgi:hydrocephalus-inducing protein